ncbi:MAG: hypothetical protein Q9222_006663 [Ikaeria aurantiellina]
MTSGSTYTTSGSSYTSSGNAYTMPVLPPTGEPAEYNDNYILYWNSVALDLNRLTVSLFNGPQNDPPSAARSLAILHIAINDAYFAIHPSSTAPTYLTTSGSDLSIRLPPIPSGGDARLAVAGAAITVLRQLYTTPYPTIPNSTSILLGQFIDGATAQFPTLNALSPSFAFGKAVGQAVLKLLDQGLGPFDQAGYRPTPGRYKFDDDPTNPVRIVPVDVNHPDGPTKAIQVYSSPFYGFVGKRIAVQKDHLLGDPPVGFGVNKIDEYNFAFQEDYRQGGAQSLSTTSRRPDQTITGFFWAYDGENLIGTPPRHYDQILRKIAVDRKPNADITHEANNADFARLFALANAALGDAGIFAWLGKYQFEFWRPLSGVRQDVANPRFDPFWLTQGAPESNTNNIAKKPPFPAYPSGHATFGGAFFQAVRLYYKKRDKLTFADDAPDGISFTAISDELNGIARDLRQPYDPSKPLTDQLGTVRTNVPKKFTSLWDAMFDNAISRVYLGVHWGFDAFSPTDVVASMQLQSDGTVAYKSTDIIRYKTLGTRKDKGSKLFPLGGVPLGIEIANDIFQSNLKQASLSPQAAGVDHPPKASAAPGAAESDGQQTAINGDAQTS